MKKLSLIFAIISLLATNAYAHPNHIGAIKTIHEKHDTKLTSEGETAPSGTHPNAKTVLKALMESQASRYPEISEALCVSIAMIVVGASLYEFAPLPEMKASGIGMMIMGAVVIPTVVKTAISEEQSE